MRYLFDGGEQVVDAEGNARPAEPFRVYTDRVSGTEVTGDMTTPDGVTIVNPETNLDGEIPDLCGPDGMKGPLYRDMGTSTRSAWYSAEAIKATDALTIETRDLLDATSPLLPAGGNNGDVLYRVADRTGAWGAPTGGGGGGVADWDTMVDKPSTFPPSSHTHGSGEITDSTTVGRAVLTAVDVNAARQAIGAQIAGSYATTTDLAGKSNTNHTHTAATIPFTPAAPLTATDVQTAISQAAAQAGSSAVSQVLVWRYTGGAWPALPVTKPTGVYEVRALGPSYPTTLPSWTGLAANQIPLSYSKVATL